MSVVLAIICVIYMLPILTIFTNTITIYIRHQRKEIHFICRNSHLLTFPLQHNSFPWNYALFIFRNQQSGQSFL